MRNNNMLDNNKKTLYSEVVMQMSVEKSKATASRIFTLLKTHRLLLAYIVIALASLYKAITKLPKEIIQYGCDWTNVCIIAVQTLVIVLFGVLCYKHKNSENLKKAATAFLWLIPVILIIDACFGIWPLPPLRHDKEILCFMSSTLLLFWAFRRWVTWPVLCCVFFITFFRLGVYLFYNVPLNPLTVAEALGATPEDYLPFITWYNIALVALAVVLSSYSAWNVCRMLQRRYSAWYLIFGATLALVVAGNLLKNGENQVFRKNGLFDLTRTLSFSRELRNANLDIIDHLPPASEKDSINCALNGNEGFVFVVHIGESVRADHLSSNGYERRTDPFIADYKKKINFNHCISCAPNTTWATLAIMTDARASLPQVLRTGEKELGPHCSSFLDLLAKAGIKTYSLIGKPDTDAKGIFVAQFDHLIKQYMKYADTRFATYAETEQIDATRRILASDKGNLCLVINNLGSHLTFDNYNHEHPTFTPVSDAAYFKHPETDKQVAQEVINCYDNTIVKTDEFIREIVQLIGNRPFLYMYVSDHGEFLSAAEGWKRRSDYVKYYQNKCCEVPFFILYSDNLGEYCPAVADALKRLSGNSHLRVAQEHIFHTVCGLFTLESPYYIPSLDLTTDSPEEYNGPCPDNGGKSTDGRKWYQATE